MSGESSALEQYFRLRVNLAAMGQGLLSRRVAQVAVAAGSAPEAGSTVPASSVGDSSNVHAFGSLATSPKTQCLPQDACI